MRRLTGLGLLLVLIGCGRANQHEGSAEGGAGAQTTAYTDEECPPEVDAAIRGAVAKYKLPRWFYYAVVHRESSFNPTHKNTTDGGVGLTQLTGAWYNGTPYPQNLSAPDNNYMPWRYNMLLDQKGFEKWIDMKDVSRLNAGEWSDPVKNLDRYSTGYAAPMFHLLRSRYPNEPLTTTLRRLAFHWRYGVDETTYPNDPASYFPGTYGYDAYIAKYKAPIEAEDGVWNGVVAKPPYATSTPTPTGPTAPSGSGNKTYEAESMYASVGGPTAGGWYLWDNGYLAANHTFTAGTTTLTVVAYGQQAGGAWPHMVVTVGGAEVGNTTVSATSWTSYTFTFSATAGTKEVRVVFDNDWYDDATGADRNLLVDKVTITGPSTPPPPAVAVSVSPTSASVTAGATKQFSASVTNSSNTTVLWKVEQTSGCGSITQTGLYTAPATAATCQVRATSAADTSKSALATITVSASTPTCTASTYEAENMTHSTGGTVSGGWNIWSNGYIATTHTFAATSTTITVTARGDQAGGVGPHMIVSVGGVAIGNTTVTATSAWAGYTFTFTATAGAKEVRVTFDNDTNTGGDRNLMVDKVAVSCGSSGGTTGGTTGATTAGTTGSTTGSTTGATTGSSFPTNPITFAKNSPFTINSGTTDYVYVPSAYDATHNTPITLFVFLHGCGGESSGNVWTVSPGGTTQTWITLAPGGREAGSTVNGEYQNGCWRAQDTSIVMASIAKLKTHFNIKPKGIIVGGYSSGGELAYRTAFLNARSFAGVVGENTGPFSMISQTDALAAAAWKFNFAHLAHTSDDTFPIGTVKANVTTLKNAGYPGTLIERAGTHWDDPGSLPGTDADFATYLFPYLKAGWSAP